MISLQNAQGDFMNAIQDFSGVVSILATDPSQLGTIGVGDLLDGIEKMIDAALQFCNAVAQGFLGLIDDGINGMVAMLNTPLSLGPINLLWDWMGEQAGSTSTPFTLGALLSLIAAFPCTVIYKLINGADAQPFENGSLPAPNAMDRRLAADNGGLFKTALRRNSYEVASYAAFAVF
jgi:hypothetical protein